MRQLWLLGMLLFAFCACGDRKVREVIGEPGKQASVVREQVAVGAEEVKAEPMLKVDSLGLKCEDNTGTYEIGVDFVSGGNKALTNAIKRFVLESLNGSKDYASLDNKELLDNCLADVIKEYHEMSDGLGEPYSSSLAYHAEVDMVYQDDKYVTMVCNLGEYTGGAHGMHAVSGKTFCKADGRTIGWDMVKDYQSVKFQILIGEGLKEYFEVKTDTELWDCLMLDNPPLIPLPRCAPLFVENGVKFVYNEYEIACYAAGRPSFVVPYAKIAPFINMP